MEQVSVINHGEVIFTFDTIKIFQVSMNAGVIHVKDNDGNVIGNICNRGGYSFDEIHEILAANLLRVDDTVALLERINVVEDFEVCLNNNVITIHQSSGDCKMSASLAFANGTLNYQVYNDGTCVKNAIIKTRFASVEQIMDAIERAPVICIGAMEDLVA